ncbi:MAG: RsmD family RNA methyltransferase [Candidatus Saccharibacteria bacterium]|nr:RsmD family RNA methyltransferase [Candidatus Saccharibacteria bacterium]
MNITSGIFRGRKLNSPKDERTHPMGSRERLALFNSLGSLEGLTVLDAYAGSGAVGLEALSRGATHVTFIEKSRKVAEVLKENIKTLGVESQTDIIIGDVAQNLTTNYDIIIADPPYDKPLDANLLNELASHAGVFVLSHPESFNPAEINRELSSSKAYANARISIYRQNY